MKTFFAIFLLLGLNLAHASRTDIRSEKTFEAVRKNLWYFGVEIEEDQKEDVNLASYLPEELSRAIEKGQK